ncbi:MAG: ABC transporter substrate-binding protein [Gammaproteobacteria bacterium]|uniref:ABC transporter substrate-binding protein n=1 Tax=Limnobacter sp. TaxID=2003368 RepID=UPI001D94F0E6|nr:ABC transporter substrate-binding protein [Limnobacter sp.]MBU0783783.1 ABC transporter substrate-binding protein [Gammaproteobacteria bacterium]MBU0847817.1 ABC transporter substrate-binding protein [Gammaproteobacteria bacterium]MBU1267049.1 ABC transporter substrate-binding protein [Gammaproteobacteria bacterium]MBU1527961.1 ABC transporter substrate-binding protein [Gammaproteobacteria bacterium]MBU1778754.1 ABC transporter substrate-binding protein [Gammaproteobacteria bacterium]
MKLKPIATGLMALFAFAAGSAQAQMSNDTIKIGMITDMSGLYADIDGPGGVEAVKMAIADFGGKLNGKKIEFVFADHQNKADIAASKAREWFDTEGVDMLISGTNSGTALAMAKVAAEKQKPNFVIGAGTARITNEECNPYSVHYAYDTVAMAKGTGSAVTKQGGKNWYFLTADYAFGTSLETDTTAVVKANGGTVKGAVRHPLSASDFSSFMLQAQASGAQILGLANAGGDTINSIKAANEFGVTGTMKLAGLLMFINDVHALGLGQTKGMYLTDSWYWDQSDESRKWAQRFFSKMKKMPSSLHAADYSATLQYLNAVKTAGTDDGAKVMDALRKQKVNDMYAKNGYYRIDGSMIHDMFLMQVKDAKESKKPWDYLKVVQSIPGEEAFTTKAETKCALWK